MVSSRKAKHEELTVNCEFEGCERKFVTENGMRNHLSSVHKIKGKNFSNRTDEEKSSTICQNCHVDFLTVKSRAAHGSPEKCARRITNSNWKTFICQNIECGKEFEKYSGPDGKRKGTKYCSQECFNSSSVRNILPIVDKICENVNCNKQFTTKRENQKFCSLSCSNNYSGYEVKDSSKMGGPREGGGHSKLFPYTNNNGEEMKLNKEEIVLAEYLDDCNYNWTRNLSNGFPYIDLNGKNRKFYPDFYLNDLNLYIEYKGWITEKMTHKMADAVKKNCDLQLCIVVGNDRRVIDMGININDLISGVDSIRVNT